MKRMATLLAAALLALATSCSQTDEPEYKPMDTEALAAQIEALPGVTSVDIGFAGSAGVGGSTPRYSGQVGIDATADPMLLLDQVLAILWQGQEGADLDVAVRHGDAFYDATSAHLGAARLKERYGEQPGTGLPPPDKPALRLRR